MRLPRRAIAILPPEAPAPDELGPVERGIYESLPRNSLILRFEHATWGFSFAMLDQTVMFPIYLDRLGASEVVIGAVPAVFLFCAISFQLLSAYLTDQLRTRRVAFVISHIPMLWMWLALAWVALSVTETPAPMAIALSLVAYAIAGAALGCSSPLWFGLQAKLFPEELRGSRMGSVFFWGGAMGLAGAAVAHRVLHYLPFPLCYAVLFVAAVAVKTIGTASFLWMREPPTEPDAATSDFREFTRRLWQAIAGMPAFRNILIAGALANCATMAAVFVGVAGKTQLSLGLSSAALFGGTLTAARILGSWGFGRLGDRMGFRLVAALAPLCYAFSALVAWVGGHLGAYILALALIGLGGAANSLGFSNLTMQVCPYRDKTTFLAVRTTFTGPFLAVAPFAGGLLARHSALGYQATFPVAAAIGVVAAAVLFSGKLGREAKGAEG